MNTKALSSITNEEFILPVIGERQRWHVAAEQPEITIKRGGREIRIMSRQGATKWVSADVVVRVVGIYDPFKEGRDVKDNY